MLSFFRRALKSWVVVLVLGLIVVAVLVTGVGTPAGFAGGSGDADGEKIATMKGGSLGSVEANQRVHDAFQQALQQNPSLDMAGFVNSGGVELALRRVISAKAIELWGERHGIVASKRLVDGEIASIPAFQGPTGKFDENVFRGLLARQRVTEAQVRDDISGDAIRRQLLGPIAGGTRATDTLVTPYAAMLLERRDGQIGVVPAALMAKGAPPSEAAINAYYRTNIVSFSLPERRVVRYALIGAPQVPAAVASDAEIQAAYGAGAAKYAAHQSRTLSQVLLPNEAAARAMVAKIRAGTSFAAAAQAAGFAPSDTALGSKTQPDYAELSSPAVAAAVFKAAEGATTDPQRSSLGYHVVHIDKITDTPVTPLSAVRATLADEIGKRKTTDALVTFVGKVEDSISNGATFDQAAAANKLTVVTTPPVLSSGVAPGVAGWTPPAVLPPLLKVAFDAGANDAPTVETLGPGSYALLAVGSVVPAAPIPLAQVRSQVVAALVARQAFDQAKMLADAIVAKTAAGTPLATAFAQSGVKLPAPQAAGGRQIDLAQHQGQVPPALAMMFSMAKGKTRLLAAPNNAGWFVVHLDTITPGDLKSAPQLLASTRDEFARALGSEYADQFISAVMQEVNVKQNAGAVARLKASLLQSNVAP